MTSIFRRMPMWTVALVLMLGICSHNLRAEEGEASAGGATDSATAAGAADRDTDAAVTDKAVRFRVPEGGVTDQLAFLGRITRPDEPFKSVEEANAYWGQAARAMATSADRILAASDVKPDQASKAVQFKAEALRIKSTLGDQKADQQREEFLDAMLTDPRLEVKSVVGPLRLIPKLGRRWMQLDAAEHARVLNRYVADVKAGGPTAGQAQLLMTLADEMADSPESKLAADALAQLLPVMREGSDPQLKEIVPVLEGIHRRLELPGNPLELEGTLIDGKPFDWESYRGKVVLVDFWASWCPECLAETPNIVRAYDEYHDKGFEVVGICLDKNSEKLKAEQTVSQHGMVWPQLFESKPASNGWTHPMAEKYAIMGIPRMMLVDQKGNVVTTLARGRILQSSLERLLGPPVAKSGAASGTESSGGSQ